MDRKEIHITQMSCCTCIHNNESFFIFDSVASLNLSPMLFICSGNVPEELFKDLENSKIIRKLKDYTTIQEDNIIISFSAQPLFGYSEEKMKYVIFELFKKYDL